MLDFFSIYGGSSDPRRSFFLPFHLSIFVCLFVSFHISSCPSFFLTFCLFFPSIFLSFFPSVSLSSPPLSRPLPSSCRVGCRLREQHVGPSGQRAVPLHAAAAAAASAAAGAPAQQRPPLQLLLRLRLGPQHVPEQLPLLAHLGRPAQLLPGLQQHRRLPWRRPGLCTRRLWLLRSVTQPQSCYDYYWKIEFSKVVSFLLPQYPARPVAAYPAGTPCWRVRTSTSEAAAASRPSDSLFTTALVIPPPPVPSASRRATPHSPLHPPCPPRMDLLPAYTLVNMASTEITLFFSRQVSHSLLKLHN